MPLGTTQGKRPQMSSRLRRQHFDEEVAAVAVFCPVNRILGSSLKRTCTWSSEKAIRLLHDHGLGGLVCEGGSKS